MLPAFQPSNCFIEFGSLTTWLLPGDSILVIYGNHANGVLLKLFLKCITEINLGTLFLYEDVFFYPATDKIIVKRPKNIVVLEAETKLIRQNAFFNGQARILWLSEELDVLDIKLTQLWEETRGSYIAGLDITSKTVLIVTGNLKDRCNTSQTFTFKNGFEKSGGKLVSAAERKLEDYRGCPLVTHMFSIPPYVPYDRSQTKGAAEYLTLLTIAEKLKLLVEYVELPEGETLYDLIVNETLRGCVKLLFNRNIDVCFGGIYPYWHQYYYVDFCVPHLESYLVWFGPLPKILSPVHNLYLGFKYEVWILVLTTTICFAILTFLIENRNKKSASSIVMHVLAASINYPIGSLHSRLMRSCFLIFYAYSLIITAVYQSVLTSFYSKTPTESPIDTMEKAVDAKIEINIFFGHISLVFGSPTALNQRLLKQKTYKSVDGFGLRDVASRQTGAFMGEKASGMFMIKAQNNTMLMMKPIFSNAPLSLLLSPDSHFKKIFDPIILRIVQGGLIVKWQRDTPSLNTPKIKPDKAPLTLSNLLGAFYVLVTFSALSLIIFTVEVTLNFTEINNRNNKTTKRNTKRFK